MSRKKELFTLDAKITCFYSLEESEPKFELERCTMLVGDGTYNGVYFPCEELEKSYFTFENKPININHSDDLIEDIVGYLEDVRYEDGKLTAKPVFDEATSKYDVAMGYMKSRTNAGDIPNVSVGLWLNREIEESEGEKKIVARELEGDHLALVVHGACNPQDGCGIGLSCNKNDTDTYTVKHEDYIGKSEEYEKLKLKVEILKEEIE